MTRSKFKSPVLQLKITDEQYAEAERSRSGACLIADAIKEQYPQFVNVAVDMATIRFTDRKAGERYIYLTPQPAQHLLLSFDQGWPNPASELTVRRAVKIEVLRDRGPRTEQTRAERLKELEGKVERDEASTAERRALTRMRRRPKRTRSVKTEVSSVQGGHRPVVRTGTSTPLGKTHPNLLRGTDRHFGAKLADPGLAFKEAVEVAVAERLAEVKAAQE